MRRYTREEFEDLAAGYALGATSPEENLAVEQMLVDAPELASDVRAYRELAVRLAEQRAVAAPPALRDEFLTRIRDAKRVPFPPASSAPVAGPATTVTPLRRRTPQIWMSMGLAASLLIAAALGYQNRDLRRSLDARAGELAATQSKLARRETTLDALLEAEKDLYVVQMKAADTVTGPGIQFFWNEKQHKGIAHAFRLKPAPAGKAYQLWLIRNGKPESVKVFNSDADGHALVEGLTLPDKVDGVTQVLLTLEPAGGSPLPTTTPFIGGALVKS